MKDRFELDDIKDIHVGDVPIAKMGVIDSLTGKDTHKDSVPLEKLSSYRKGHEIGTHIENLLKGDQVDHKKDEPEID